MTTVADLRSQLDLSQLESASIKVSVFLSVCALSLSLSVPPSVAHTQTLSYCDYKLEASPVLKIKKN